MSELSITSNGDDSVTLRGFDLVVHIKGPTWARANAAAHTFAATLRGAHDLGEAVRIASRIRAVAEDIEHSMGTIERFGREMVSSLHALNTSEKNR